ncbi:site-specific DNA-methyltransferase [Proteus mirabilis]|uniref:site-specific DNA-methyltransferase n=1 Tax=Proteus mirabilis TaxID=584 RepID=UPI00132CDAF8|nr:site-specific DNA-methyltransferase [Proteus mirabilis]MCT0097435.1 site-specific DNA-methyltransferase [Proteus mirabilis]MDC9758389.1 site-specific DNA-methyltransferase [Proteus mirabilis]MDC9772530.1 site-specific DNA-methyltransferase [Proteus mirabilis]HEK3219453.1 site-specific DNA-methyltransferase [Proteus mirabilis]
MKTELMKNLILVLSNFPHFWDGNELNRSMVINAINNKEPDIIKALVNNKKISSIYGVKIDNIFIFDFDGLCRLLKYKEYWDSSFTKYRNKIGLTVENKYIDYNSDVVLSFPFKDCVLEGGMTKEDEPKNEVYYNNIIAKDEIDRIFSEKVLTNTNLYTKDSITNDIIDAQASNNFIIKGNNLIALHSLKKKYKNKVKLIYIDPPYNPPSNNNTFSYNNKFNHSTWLTFMKNRLEAAKDLLRKDGVFIIAIDENEVHYLGVLINELFPDYESHCITIIHNPRGVQGTNFSYCHEYAFFIFPRGMKVIGNRKIEKEDIDFSNLRNWGSESERKDAKNCFYGIVVNKKNNQIIEFMDISDDNYHPDMNVHLNDELVVIYPIDKSGVERKWRYARQSVEKVKDLLKVKNNKGIYDIQIGKDFGSYKTVWANPKYDANEYGTKIVNSLVKNNNFSFPKSLWNVYDCIHAVTANDKDAIILDYHAGSGTTAHAVMELNKEDDGNRKFILIEQMDYIKNITCERVYSVIKKNNNNTSFIYTELMELNAYFVHEIQKAQSTEELEKLFAVMKTEAHLNYQVALENVLSAEYEMDGIPRKVAFSELELHEQKQLLIEILDKNQLYVNASEMDDSDLNISESDKAFTRSFYGME